MKISCCILTRDDESTLRACLESIRPHVQELICVDTGSADSSPAIGREFADKWELFLGCNEAKTGLIEDFAMARNHSFSLATGDWIIWLDSDDVIRGAEHLRELTEMATADNHAYLFPYEYARDAAGNVTCLQYRERLMRPPSAWRWQSPVHEYCSIQGEPAGSTLTVATERVIVEHRQQHSTKVREPGRNLRILRNYVARVGETDVRALYYLGVEYAMHGDVGQSLRYLKRYAQLADWDDEKCKALLAVGEHYRNIGDHELAIRWSQDAMITKSWPEPWFAMGRSFYAMAKRDERPEYNYKRAAYHFMRGLDHPTDVVLFANPQERHEIHAFLNVCFHAVGDLERALWSCDEGLKGIPNHPMLTDNRRVYAREKLRRTVVGGIDELLTDGAISKDQAGLMRATLSGELRLEAPPTAPESVPALEPQPVAPGKLDIALFLGPALERWTPETWAKTGMGGSETMAWEMARRLRKLGHRVRFYTDCTASQQGIYEGVEWVPWERFKGITCDVLISSRFPEAVDDEFGCKATARILYVHDVHCGDRLDMRRTARFDRILCLTEWHKRFFVGCYAGMDADKVHVTQNAIDLSRFEGTEERVATRAVYSSSPDRGLLAAVQAWPRVRALVPDAELHCYYGFENWEKSVQNDPGRAPELGQIQHIKRLIETTPGVVPHGRINQKELAREFMRAGVMASPTWFSETFGIAFAEAQAAGLCIVTSAIAALRETVKVGCLIDWESDTQTPTADYVDEWVKQVVAAMTEPRDDVREKAMAAAREHFDLDDLAKDWDEWLFEMHAELKENVVAKFKDVVIGGAE